MNAAANDVTTIRTEFLLRAVLGFYRVASDATVINAEILEKANALRQYFTWVQGELVPEEESRLRSVLEKILRDLSHKCLLYSVSFRAPTTSK